MRPARYIETIDIALDDLDVSSRKRPVSDVGVQSLKVSLEMLGLQNEIQVRRVAHQDGRHVLMAGGHRVEAYRQMGKSHIPAKIFDCTDDWAELIEIDDNLAQADLNGLDLAVFLADRKTIYERMYPETKQGGKRGNQHTGGFQNDMMSFCQTMAESREVSRKTIERLVGIGNALGKGEIEQLRAGKNQPTLGDLQVLIKCASPADRTAIIVALADGSAKTAKQALNTSKAPGAAIKDPVEKDLKRLNDAFQRASNRAKIQFAREHQGVLQILLDTTAAERTAIPAEAIPFKAQLQQQKPTSITSTSGRPCM